ncbi:MAG TPA: hypothetical protein VF661_01640 [Actinomycetales bacterium]|jgi:hypothetical protein
MSPTVDDLRALARTDGADVPAHPERLARLRRTVVRRRRARTAGGSLAVLAIAVGAFTLVGPDAGRRAQPPATTRPTSTPLPEYREGGRLIAQTELTGRIGDTRSFSFTPSSWGLMAVPSCTAPAGRSVSVAVTVNGNAYLTGPCTTGTSTRGPFEQDARAWRPLGVEPGQRSAVSVTVIAGTDAGGAPYPDADSAGATVRFGLYQDVPAGQYPLPERPAQVRRPDSDSTWNNGPPPATITEVTMPGANGTSSRTVPWAPTVALDLALRAPGRVRVLVDGEVVGGLASWGYEPRDGGVDLSPQALEAAGVRAPRAGDPITVTVEAEQFQDPGWRVSIGDVATTASPAATPAAPEVTAMPGVTPPPTSDSPGIDSPLVSRQLRETADAAVAAHPLLRRMEDAGGGLVLTAEGPWTDGQGRPLGVARQYRLAAPADVPALVWPHLRYLDEKQTRYAVGSSTMSVRGMREIHVVVRADGEVVAVDTTDRDDVSVTRVDPGRP